MSRPSPHRSPGAGVVTLTYPKHKSPTRRAIEGAGDKPGTDREDAHQASSGALSHGKRTEGISNPGPATKNENPESLRGIDPQPAAAVGGTQQAIRELSPTKNRQESEMILDDEVAPIRDTKTNVSPRWVSRDRLTVDKDAPELRRRHELWRRASEDDEDHRDAPAQPEEEPDEPEGPSEAVIEAPRVRRARFNARQAVVGDPALTDPQRIMAILGSPHAYAKHVLLLAETFRASTGATREEAIAYLALLFVAAPSRAFGRAALRELTSTIGIVDIYPLEVVEFILQHYPPFLPSAAFGRLFCPDVLERPLLLKMQTGQDQSLPHDDRFKIRSFALRGGHRPGYAFWPARAHGCYRLRLDRPGRYDLLISGMNAAGFTMVDALRAEVEGHMKAPDAPRSVRVRNPERIATWPMPEPVQIDPLDVFAPRSRSGSTGMNDGGELGYSPSIADSRAPKSSSPPAVHDHDIPVPSSLEPGETTEPELAVARPERSAARAAGPIPQAPLGPDDEPEGLSPSPSAVTTVPADAQPDRPGKGRPAGEQRGPLVLPPPLLLDDEDTD